MTTVALPAAGLPRSAGGPACSTASRAAGETLAATAALGRRWLLVEVAGAWGRDAFTDSPALDPGVGRRLARRAQQHGLRIAAIRRPGRARGSARWRWAVADTAVGAESVRWGEAAAPDDLLELPLDGSAGAPSADPVVLVCAHGRHDECCAVRGVALAASLARAHPHETWEASHLGGDRFAATTLLLPHGLSHGRVDDQDADAIVAAYRAGRIHPAGFRGRTTFPRVVQAAQQAAREESGDWSVDAFAPLVVEQRASDWRIVLDAAPRIEVVVSGSSAGPLYTTCTASRPVHVPHFAAAQAPVPTVSA